MTTGNRLCLLYFRYACGHVRSGGKWQPHPFGWEPSIDTEKCLDWRI